MRNGFRGQVRPQQYANNFAVQVDMFRKAGAIPVDLTDPQAELVLMRGAEMGISPVIALNQIRVKEGKTIVAFELLRALVNRSGLLRFEERQDNAVGCSVRLMHINGRVEIAHFSVKQAKQFNLLEKESWQQDQSEMLYERAYLKAVRTLFPEISLGLVIQDEFIETPSLFKQAWNFLKNFIFPKAKKTSTKIIKASLSKQQSQKPSNTTNTGVARILAKQAVQAVQNKQDKQDKAIKAC